MGKCGIDVTLPVKGVSRNASGGQLINDVMKVFI
jgi:hypothetical protein